MTHDNNWNLAIDWFQLLKSSQNENGCLTHTGFGLAEDIHVQNLENDCQWFKNRIKNLQLVEYIRFELGKDAQNHSQQLHVAIQAYEVTNTVTH